MAHAHHGALAGEAIGVRVLTCSDSRTEADDHSGRLMCERLRRDGHKLVAYHIVADEPETIRARLAEAVADPETRVVMINGGTGISPRDSTYEVVAGLLDKRIDGFGELFRSLSYRQVGAAAMLSRAVAGLCGRTVLISVPGSEKAVQLALDELILPELRHMAWLVA